MKKFGAKVAIVAVAVVAAIVVLKVLGGVLRWVLSIALFLLACFLVFRIINVIKK